ncbi:MAG: amidoligase family protein [Polyangiales bacterium]
MHTAIDTMKRLPFGIEIECVGLERARLAAAIQGALGGDATHDYRGSQVTDAKQRVWRIVPDGSLSDGQYSGEIVSPILRYEDLDDLQTLVRAVRTAGARANSSCGIHYARQVVMRGPRCDAFVPRFVHVCSRS